MKKAQVVETEVYSREPIIGTAQRRKFADITNLQPPPKLSSQGSNKLTSTPSRDYIDKLEKEITSLKKVLVDRNKLIELGMIEMQKLRISFQNLQQQNLQLAQANSMMVAELNTKKDRLKTLQHELGCKNGLLKLSQGCLEVGPKKHDEAENPLHEDNTNIRTCHSKRQQQLTIKSAGSMDDMSLQMTMNADSKRVKRRKSCNYKPEQPEGTCGATTVLKAEDNSQKKSLSLRRRSARFKPEELEGVCPIEAVNNADGNSVCKRVSGKRKSYKSKAEELGGTLVPVVNSADKNIDREMSARKSYGQRHSARRTSQEPQIQEILCEADAVEVGVETLGIPVTDSDGYKSQQLDQTRRNLHGLVEGSKRRPDPENHSDKNLPQRSSGRDSEDGRPVKDLSGNDDPDHSVSASREYMSEEKGILSESEAARTSLGRPLRQAAGKVHSYKEVSLKVKMRRPE